MLLRRTRNLVRSLWLGRNVAVWYHPAYRVPLAGAESSLGMEPRRADFVHWYALERRLITPAQVRTPPLIGWEELARVHTAGLLESLSTPQGLAHIFSATPEEIPVEEMLRMVRLGAGGTLQACYHTLSTGSPTVNLLGGFHHAGRGRAGGFCAVNDMAVAVAALRSNGFTGRVCILDLDAHPPDGTADCLQDDPAVWQGSISGAAWTALPGVDEVRVPVGCTDAIYLEALRGLLGRMPTPALAFVIAGADVLAGDRLGSLALTRAGVRARELAVWRHLQGVPQVWLPGGGYSPQAWCVLADVVELVCTHRLRGVPSRYDPLAAQFASVAASLQDDRLGSSSWLTDEDLFELTGVRPTGGLFMGFYTPAGLEYALFRYGMVEHLHRLGYADIRVETRVGTETGDILRVWGRSHGRDWLLMDLQVARRTIAGHQVLFVNWLELMHPRASYSEERPRLPGQRYPGLGLAREATQLLERLAHRLGLDGVAFRPAHLHVAYGARHTFRFVDPLRQSRFERLLEATTSMPLVAASKAVDQHRVTLNGEPYAWEASEMVHWLVPHAVEPAPEGPSCQFAVLPAPPA